MKSQQIQNKKHFNTNLENKNIIKIVPTFKINDVKIVNIRCCTHFFKNLKNFASWRSFKKSINRIFFNIINNEKKTSNQW